MFSLIVLILASPAEAARVVSVQGRCEIKVAPDRASVQLKTEKTSQDTGEAVDQVSKKVEAAKIAIQKMGLKDLELRTTHFQLYEHREWENNKNVLKGHRASLGLEVTTSEIPKLGEVMAKAASLGLTGAEGFRTFLSIEKSQLEYLKCLKVASRDAQDKAEELARNLGAKLGEVEAIHESPAMIHSPQPVYAAAAMMEGAAMAKGVAAPSIEVGEQTFTTTLSVSFQLK